MIDRCKCNINYQRAEEIDRILSRTDFIWQKEYVSNYSKEPIHLFELKNMKVRYFPLSNEIKFENSIHKLRHTNNYCDFSISEIVETTEFLSDTFEKRTDEINVRGFEFALIVNTPEKPKFYFDKFISIRSKPFFYLPPPYNQSEPLEKYCPFTQFNVKYYDTGKWNGVKGGNLLKGEIVVKKMQKIYALTGRNSLRSPITISDFTDKRFLDTMANFHLKTYRSIIKQPLIDYRHYKPRERDFILASTFYPDYWEEEKQMNLNTAKKKRTRYLHLLKELSKNGGEPYRELEELFKSKYEQLITS